MSLKLPSSRKTLHLITPCSTELPCLSDRLPEIKTSNHNSLAYLSLNSLDKTPPRARGKANTFAGLINHKGPVPRSQYLPGVRATLPPQSDSRAMLSLPKIPGATKPVQTWSNALMDSEDKSSNSKYVFQPGFILSKEQNREECEARHGQIQSSIEELCSMEIIDHRNKYSYEKDQLVRDTERTYKLAESILSVMGVQVRSFIGNAYDSSMMIHPITDKVRLANFYKIFVPEMCRFNYTFISKLRLNTISVCESLRLTSKDYVTVLNQKLHNGLFILERTGDRKSIQQHWFKVILHHFFKIAPDFYNEWQEMLLSIEGAKPGKAFEELLSTFNYMIGVDREIHGKSDGIKLKEKFLREAFEEFGLIEEDKNKDE